MRNRFILFTIALLSVLLVACDKHEMRETKYDNGQLKEQFSVLETEDGSFIKDGEYKTWFPSSQQESNGQYEKGKQQGNWKFWYSNGQMKSDYNFVRDTLDDPFKKWYENGQKLIEGTKKMGKEVGPWTAWYENGQMSSKENYDQESNFEGTQTYWHKNGQKSKEISYVKGVKEGEWKFWDTEGKLYVSRTFRNGTDTNLPSTYKNKSGETLELMADGTYKLTYKESLFFSTQWKTKTGKFEVTEDNLELNDFRNLRLKKFSPDTIICVSYNEMVFIKKTDTK